MEANRPGSAQERPRAPDVSDIELVLSRMPWPTIRFIRIEVQEGIVRLSGCVGSYYEKQIADREVQQLPGVRKVKDQIEVFYP